MMNGRHILVIEDDDAIRRGVVDALEFAGYDVSQCSCGETGMQMALERPFDLLLLDLILPDHDGLHILGTIRSDRPQLPVIVLTARGTESDRVRGLKLGADDYVVKPFSVTELVARVEAVLRRSQPGRRSMQLAFEDGQVDFERQRIEFHDGEIQDLSLREVGILMYLAHHPDKVVSRDELLERVWGLDPRGLQSRTVDMHIARLRDKLGGHAQSPFIVTVRGRGYLLDASRVTLTESNGHSH